MFFSAKEETEVIGYIGMKVVLDEADITNVAVLPAYRKKGIARKLLQQLLDEARQQGIYSIYLEVRDSNAAAITLYKHAGFKEVGKRKNYYETSTGRCQAYVMAILKIPIVTNVFQHIFLYN